MKKNITSLVVALAITLGFGTLTALPAGAINVFDEGCKGQTSKICKETSSDTVNPIIQDIIGTLIFAIATISVIMIIVGGIRYVISNGDASKIKSAKDTILYSVIGLAVALLAYAIVNFVIQQFS